VARKLCRPSGDWALKSVANQFAIEASAATIPHSAHQMMCGIARMSRKKTVSRFRCRSSLTTSLTGWRCCAESCWASSMRGS
jgi:hypothetical protein